MHQFKSTKPPKSLIYLCMYSYLESSNGCTLEAQISLEILGNFSHQTLEGQFADEQFG